MYGHVITKFSRMGSLPHFFTHGAPLRASRARAPLLWRKLARGCGIVNLFTESHKVYEEVLDRAINFEFRYSGARPLRDLKTIKAFWISR